jgi:hypothetical protein
MGTLIVLAVFVLGLFLGMVIISLLSLEQKGEQIYNLMYRGEEISTPADTYYGPASETLRPPAAARWNPRVI